MSRFVVSCGGTGGHLAPGIALAEGLQARGHEAVLLLSQKKVDTRLSEKYPNLRCERMPGTGFSWQPVRLLRCAGSQTAALRFCLGLLRRHRTDVAVGFGGFTSAPLVLAARLRGVPAALHESNRVPGLAVRTLGRLARRVYLPPGIRIAGLGADTVRHTGMPVRREIARQPAAAARAALGLEPDRPVLLVLGGSQGATALNDWARANFERLAADGIQTYVVTGMGKGREGAVELRTADGAPVRAVFTAFSDRMAELMSAADLAVSRAGAGTLAELARCGTPALLVPYPQAADDHQRANAEYFAREGGGALVPQTRLADLYAKVRDTIADGDRLRRYRDNLHRMDRADPLGLMLDDLEEIARAAAARRKPERRAEEAATS